MWSSFIICSAFYFEITFMWTSSSTWTKEQNCMCNRCSYGASVKMETSSKCWFAAQKKTFSINDFFSKCDQIRRKLRIRLRLLKKSLMENFIFSAVVEPITCFTYSQFCSIFYSQKQVFHKNVFIKKLCKFHWGLSLPESFSNTHDLGFHFY